MGVGGGKELMTVIVVSKNGTSKSIMSEKCSPKSVSELKQGFSKHVPVGEHPGYMLGAAST